nr:POU domain class 2-associating factor 1 isoform X3 [Gorilla gorilla gorilla]
MLDERHTNSGRKSIEGKSTIYSSSHAATAPEQAPAPARPYQGVRVKEPVKELLRRKRGHASSGAAPAPTAVVLPHQPLATYTTVGPSCLDMEGSVSAVTEEGALCAGWLSQPTPATLQPLAPWTPYTEYVPHEAVSCPYSADMYVQPVCPSYTVVGPSSVLTYASPPLITNVTIFFRFKSSRQHLRRCIYIFVGTDGKGMKNLFCNLKKSMTSAM